MNFRRLIIAGLCCLAAACGKVDAGGGGFNADCVRNSDCAQPFYCKDAHCVLDAATVCESGKERCNGDAVEKCSDGGDRWEVKKDCPTGCANNDCRPAACTANEKKCDGSMIFQCLSNGSGWVFVQSCPTACNDTTKECSTPICSPFETRCKPDADGTLQTCNSRGTAWVDSPCADTAGAAVCVTGRCLPKVCSVTADATGAVTSREERCRGTVAEQCNDTMTGWDTKQVCTNGCDFDSTNKKAACPAAACVPFETKCSADGVTLSTCNSRGTAFVDAACDATSQRCVNGACVPKVCSVTRTGSTVVAREERCDGDIHETCDDTESKWNQLEVCKYGCTLNGTTAQCAPKVCADGETACDGLALEKCAPGNGSFGFVQYCPSGCVGSKVTDASSPARSASCAAPICAPLSRRCGTDTGTGLSYVESCKADGTGWDRVENCPQTCSAGVCVVTDSTCNDGDIRCKGFEVEQCVRVSSGATEWRFVERCLDECTNGTCGGTAGSVGCQGGVISATTATCSTAQRLPLTVKALVPAPTQADPNADKPPCDGISKVLVYTSLITSAAGTPVPDGTLVTFTHDFPAGSPDNLLASADADSATPGLQRPTLNGVAMATLLAPPASGCTAPRTVTVTATLGGRAAGNGQVTFMTPPPPAPNTPPTKKIFVVEDFTTTAKMDRITTTAAWDTGKGASVALPAYDLGTGTDGDLQVDSVRDMQAEGYARAWTVTSMGAQDVTVDNVLPSLSPGDEVLVSTIWANGGAGNVGNYEFKRVAAVASGRIVFTDNVRNTYGTAGGVFDATQRTIVQRVPQFNNVTVGTSGTLTVSAPVAQNGYPAGGTGILAFRARGTVKIVPVASTSVKAGIDLQNKGLPSLLSGYPNATSTSALSRLLLGNGSAGNNGGVLFMTAGTLTFKDTTYAGSAGIVRTDGTGTGGTMWVAGGTFDLNDAAASNPAPYVVRFVGGNAARVRADYGQIDLVSGTTGKALASSNGGTVFTGQAGAFNTQSVVVYDEKAAVPTNPMNIFSADFLGALGGPASTIVATPVDTVKGITSQIPGLSVQVSADNGASWGSANLGKATFIIPPSGQTTTAAQVGQQMKWKFSTTTLDDRPMNIRAIGFRLNLQGS